MTHQDSSGRAAGSLRTLAAPDSLKGVLPASVAAAALARGLRRVPGVSCEELPLGDGGEGTAEALFGVLGGEWRAASVHDPLGRKLEARFLLLPDGTAVVEAAAAIGIELLRPEELDPLRASSEGLGELLCRVLEQRPSRIVVCLGGSATVDGGRDLARLLAGRLEGVRLVAACDVRNPLLGERGAARVFGPQKGATPQMVEELESRLAAMTALRPYADLPGAGSAGGLGARLASLGAELRSGAELVLSLVDFAGRARGAALVVTGEGRVDLTSAEGKVAGSVAAACRELCVPCVVFGGAVETPLAGTRTEALSGVPVAAEADLEQLGEQLARELPLNA